MSRTLHRYDCRVDGGTRAHGRHGFTCPRCRELDEDDLVDLLLQVERFAGINR